MVLIETRFLVTLAVEVGLMTVLIAVGLGIVYADARKARMRRMEGHNAASSSESRLEEDAVEVKEAAQLYRAGF